VYEAAEALQRQRRLLRVLPGLPCTRTCAQWLLARDRLHIGHQLAAHVERKFRAQPPHTVQLTEPAAHL
jgi:hypothetical protein